MTNNEEFEKILENIDENGPEPQEEPERQYYFIKKARALVKKMSEELGRPLISSVTTFGWSKYIRKGCAKRCFSRNCRI